MPAKLPFFCQFFAAFRAVFRPLFSIMRIERHAVDNGWINRTTGDTTTSVQV